MMFRKQLKENHEDWRNFNYSKGDTTLSFRLRTDIKSQLKDYKELLAKALEDVEAELNKEEDNYNPGFGGGAGGAGIGAGVNIERKHPNGNS